MSQQGVFAIRPDSSHVVLVIPKEEDPSLSFNTSLTLVVKVIATKPVRRQAVLEGLLTAWNTMAGVQAACAQIFTGLLSKRKWTSFKYGMKLRGRRWTLVLSPEIASTVPVSLPLTTISPMAKLPIYPPISHSPSLDFSVPRGGHFVNPPINESLETSTKAQGLMFSICFQVDRWSPFRFKLNLVLN
ncbi:hypothetical protein NE237_028547 [Protea cynaroides]|uniref:Uncharacterized protein n=1 Tax=Protea cynaroides TaxID=273540 RepID=A0A9Q0GSL8_9MAGN|nr:hypothetical protein NE237_028547 [Protea cynaroides]